jgi:hypothetical protein
MILECMGGNILMDVKNTYASLKIPNVNGDVLRI